MLSRSLDRQSLGECIPLKNKNTASITFLYNKHMAPPCFETLLKIVMISSPTPESQVEENALTRVNDIFQKVFSNGALACMVAGKAYVYPKLVSDAWQQIKQQIVAADLADALRQQIDFQDEDVGSVLVRLRNGDVDTLKTHLKGTSLCLWGDDVYDALVDVFRALGRFKPLRAIF